MNSERGVCIEMKKILAFVLSLALCLSLSIPAMAAGSGMDNFQKSGTYTGQFTDMPDSYWGTRWAAVCYEYGLMKGQSASVFAPKENLSIAEAIVMACRIHETYTTGESTITNGKPWYQPYVDYAIAIGLIYADSFADYTAPAPRYLMAQLLYAAIPTEELTAINVISSVPDVPTDWVYAPAIYALYKAGVLTGNDSYGHFFPEANITRAEAAAVLARLAVPEFRQRITLLKKFSLSIEDTNFLLFAFPQANMASPDGLEYIYWNEENGSFLNLTFTASSAEGLSGAGISAFVSPEEVTQLVAPAFEGAQLTTSLLRYGDTEVYMTELLPGTQWDSFDQLCILNFLWEEKLIAVAIGGQNCDNLFQKVYDSLELLGSSRTDG